MPLQFLQLCIFRQVWWHPTGASSDLLSENNWDDASLVQGAAPFKVHVINKRRCTNGADAEVEDGDVIWCLRASPDMGHEIEILSVGSPSDASEAEGAAPLYA